MSAEQSKGDGLTDEERTKLTQFIQAHPTARESGSSGQQQRLQAGIKSVEQRHKKKGPPTGA